MSDNQINLRKFQFRHISWLTIALAILAVVTFIFSPRVGSDYTLSMGAREEVSVDSSGGYAMPPVDGSIAPDRYPYPNPDVPATDTRELLKVYYNAVMRSRNVQELTRRVETSVRGYGGRIDHQSSSRQYGSVSFAISQNKYDAFRNELESFVPERFLSINISSQNLLPQKLSIEEQQEQAATTLSNYTTERARIVSTHLAAVQSLEARIQTSTREGEIFTLQQQLARENASYSEQLSNIDKSIQSAQEWQRALQTQDQELLANVATVTGTVSIQWISLWGIAHLYLPGYWIPTIFAALTLLSFLWDRRRFETQ